MTAPWTADDIRRLLAWVQQADGGRLATSVHRDVEQALAAYADLLDQPAWRSIDSAPKDGQMVLLDFGEQCITSGFWEAVDETWVVCEGPHRVVQITYQPTYWMPLPRKDGNQ